MSVLSERLHEAYIHASKMNIADSRYVELSLHKEGIMIKILIKHKPENKIAGGVVPYDAIEDENYPVIPRTIDVMIEELK